MAEKIAVIVDSGANLNNHLVENTTIQSIPLRISVDGKDFTDGIDIDLDGVYAVLDHAKVTTSLPSGEAIYKQFDALKDEGYTHAIVIAISSGLSGTYNVIHSIAQTVEGIKIHVVDTKNISIGAGLYALEVNRLVESGIAFDDLVASLPHIEKHAKVYFTIGTLEYLRRGGRIGLVAGTVADVLNIKPVISCNEDGIYHTVTKVRGFSRAIKAMIDKAASAVGDRACHIALLDANHHEDRAEIVAYVKRSFPNILSIETVKVSPALAIHVGPVACGIGTYCYD